MKTKLFLFVTLLSLNSWAGQAISISPMYNEVKISDKPVSYTVEVHNETNKKIPTVRIETYDMVPKLTEGSVDIKGTIEKVSKFRPGKDYVRLSETSFSLDPKKSKVITVTILPQKNMDGSSFVSLRIKPDADISGSGIATIVSFFHNILIYNPASEKKELTTSMVSYSNEKLTLMLKNSGNTFLRPTAKVSIIKNGKIVGSYDAINSKNQNEILVFPTGSTQMFINVPKKVLTTGSIILVSLFDKNKQFVKTEKIEFKSK